MSSGGGGVVTIQNWGDMDNKWGDMEAPAYAAQSRVWMDTQANANTWASNAQQNATNWQNTLSTSRGKDRDAWTAAQDANRLAYATAEAAYAAAQTLLAGNALEAANDQAEKQYDIANRQQIIADDEYKRYTQHFAPCEDTTVDTECARPEYVEDIETEATRAVVDVRKQFALARLQLERRRVRYCVGSIIASERTLAIEEAVAVAAAKEKVRRYLEQRQEQRRDKYFNRKLQLFNLGRGLKADALSEMSAASIADSRGADIELAARNQYYGAILSSVGGLLGAGVSAASSFPLQGRRSSFGIGGISDTFSSNTNFGFNIEPQIGSGAFGPGGLGYGGQ